MLRGSRCCGHDRRSSTWRGLEVGAESDRAGC